MLRVKLVNPLFLFCLLILFSVADLMSQDFGFDRVEPPFWWVGMKNEDLQLLVLWQKHFTDRTSDFRWSNDHSTRY